MKLVKSLALWLVLFGPAINSKAEVPASLLSGEVVGLRNATVTLFRNVQGVQQNYAEYSINKSNTRFYFAVPASGEGEFVKLIIKDFAKQGIKQKDPKNFEVVLFVKQNDKLDLRIELKNGAFQQSFPKCSLVNNSAENSILLQWQQKFQQFRSTFMSIDEDPDMDKFNASYKQYKPQLSAYLSGVVCKTNPQFEKVFKEAASAKLKFTPIDFYVDNWRIIDSAVPNPTFQKLLNAAFADLKMYCGNALFSMGGMTKLKQYYYSMYRQMLMSKGTSKDALNSKLDDDSVKALICNETVKRHFNDRFSPEMIKNTDVSRATGFPQVDKNSRVAFVRVHVDGFRLASDFNLTAFEDFSNLALASIRSTSPDFMVPVSISSSRLISIDYYDLKAKILLNPGDSLDIIIYNASADTSGRRVQAKYVLRQGSAENKMLAKWYAYSYPVTRYLNYTSTQPIKEEGEEKFAADYTRMHDGLAKFVADSLGSGSVAFKQMFLSLGEFDVRLSALLYLARHQSSMGYAGPFFKGFNNEKSSSFFRQFSDGKILCQQAIYKFPDAQLLVSYVSKLQWALMPAQEKEKLPPGSKLGYQVEQLCTPEAKSCLLAWELNVNEMTNWREVKMNLLPNKPYFSTEELKAIYDRTISTLSIDTPFIGKQVINTPFADTSGRMINLGAFKGKVVFVDVWATWCGPCKGQLPYLKEIEEEYANRSDIVFVGLSVDREKDLGKWKKFIGTEKLPGIQVIDYSGKIFQRRYQILAIPRFILIDRNGIISEMRCPYPENDKELKEYLNELLNAPAKS